MDFTIISSCEARVGPQAKGYEDKAIRLARSIRSSGCGAPIVMWYATDAKPSEPTLQRLRELGCQTQEGICRHPGRTLWNKVEAATATSVQTEARLWIDSDVYVIGGLEYFTSLECDIAAAPDLFEFHALTRPEDRPLWNVFYKLCDIDSSAHRYCEVNNHRANFHCSSGVFLLKNCPALVSGYREIAERLMLSSATYGPEYFDAAALILLTLQQGLKWQFLPEAYNYVYAIRKNINGKLIHYQDNVLDSHPPIVWS